MDAPGTNEGLPKTEQGLLPLSDITGRHLEQKLRLDEKPNEETLKITHDAVESATLLTKVSESLPTDTNSTYERFAIEVVRKLKKANQPIYEVLARRIKDKFLPYMSMSMDDFTFGMAVILEGFEFESGGKLIESFQNITPAEFDEALSGLLLQPKSIIGTVSIFDIVDNQEEIPGEQIELNSILNRLKEKQGIRLFSSFFDGAEITYSLLSKLAPKLTFQEPKTVVPPNDGVT